MNLLSIRGGGSRGIIPILILKAIEERTKKPIHELFHHCGACSVGTMLVSSLLISDDGKTAKYTAHDVYTLFLKHVKNSFTWTYYSYIFQSGFGLFGPKYTSAGLHGIVKETCGDAKMKDLLKPIIFPAYDRIQNKSFYFDKEQHADVKIVDAILATTSIPTFFESHKVVIDERTHDFLDSAIVSNDCSSLVLLKATSKLEYVDKKKIFLLNLGTGVFPNVVNDRNGLLGWVGNIVNAFVLAGEDNEVYQLSLSIPRECYEIIDIPLNGFYQPDDISEKTIAYYISTTEKWIEENLLLLDAICQKLLNNCN